ncbi:MAG: hypothetical protein ACLFUU_08775 [Desulfobacteraceae bacterium]
MALLQQIRGERAQRKTKSPFRCTLFTRICALVQAYGLGPGFVDLLDQPPDHWPLDIFKLEPVPAKAPFQPPLFALATAPEYQVVMAIISKIDNPYLHFVQSPAEMLLCGPLFKLNSDLGPEVLARQHFAVLWQQQLTQRPRHP